MDSPSFRYILTSLLRASLVVVLAYRKMDCPQREKSSAEGWRPKGFMAKDWEYMG